jgi:hypothetical protein
MHNNSNHFESSHNKKFLFYSLLIERSTYLFLTTSIKEEKQRKEIFELHILKNNLSNLLVSDEKEKVINHEMKFNVAESSSSLNRIKATDELVEGKIVNHPKQRAQPLRSNLRTESMSSNIQGETIPMVYLSSFLDNRDKGGKKFININTDLSSSNYIDLENNLWIERRKIKHLTTAEPYQITNKYKSWTMRKRKKKIISDKILAIDERKIYSDQEEKFGSSHLLTNMFNRIEAANKFIEENEPIRSKQLAQLIRRNLQTEGMFSIIRGETIPIAYSSSFLDYRNKTKKGFYQI